jgi:hypothetical protein
MKRLIFALLLCVIGSSAFAQTTGPALEYFLGGTIGKRWEGAAAQTAGINAQTGTTYTILATDMGKLITFNNGGAVAVTLPAATTVGFEAFHDFKILNLGAGLVTVTPTTSTINGGATKTYAQNASGSIRSDGTNYFAY